MHNIQVKCEQDHPENKWVLKGLRSNNPMILMDILDG